MEHPELESTYSSAAHRNLLWYSTLTGRDRNQSRKVLLKWSYSRHSLHGRGRVRTTEVKGDTAKPSRGHRPTKADGSSSHTCTHLSPMPPSYFPQPAFSPAQPGPPWNKYPQAIPICRAFCLSSLHPLTQVCASLPSSPAWPMSRSLLSRVKLFSSYEDVKLPVPVIFPPPTPPFSICSCIIWY